MKFIEDMPAEEVEEETDEEVNFKWDSYHKNTLADADVDDDDNWDEDDYDVEVEYRK